MLRNSLEGAAPVKKIDFVGSENTVYVLIYFFLGTTGDEDRANSEDSYRLPGAIDPLRRTWSRRNATAFFLNLRVFATARPVSFRK